VDSKASKSPQLYVKRNLILARMYGKHPEQSFEVNSIFPWIVKICIPTDKPGFYGMIKGDAMHCCTEPYRS
jgi:hypothetical protein